MSEPVQRPAALEPGRGYVAAADIGGTRLRMMLADLSGEVLAQWSVLLQDAQKTPAGICDLVLDGLRTMCGDARISQAEVVHMTAGAPGVTDVSAGVVLAAPNLRDWVNVPLRQMLRGVSGLPILVENDTNLAAVGEHWRGAAQGVADFVLVALGTGAGAGIFLGGRLHRGARWCAGEIGYFGISGARREAIQAKETGQLERVIGGAGIEEFWRRAIAENGSGSHTSLAKLRATQIIDLAGEGDRLASGVLDLTAGLLADAIADTSLLLNPELVVLGGGVGSHPELCRRTRDALSRHDLAQPQLRSSALGWQAQLFGAVWLSITAAQPHSLL